MPARQRALTGSLAFVALIITAAVGACGSPSPGGSTTDLATTASATASGSPSQHATHTAAAVHTTASAHKTHPTTTQAASAASQAPAPPAPAAPAPTTRAAVVAPPASAAPANCYPLTNGGNCYEPGEFCRKSDHDASGVAGDGKAITCEDNDGWRWEPS